MEQEPDIWELWAAVEDNPRDPDISKHKLIASGPQTVISQLLTEQRQKIDIDYTMHRLGKCEGCRAHANATKKIDLYMRTPNAPTYIIESEYKGEKNNYAVEYDEKRIKDRLDKVTAAIDKYKLPVIFKVVTRDDSARRQEEIQRAQRMYNHAPAQPRAYPPRQREPQTNPNSQFESLFNQMVRLAAQATSVRTTTIEHNGIIMQAVIVQPGGLSPGGLMPGGMPPRANPSRQHDHNSDDQDEIDEIRQFFRQFRS